MFYSFFFFIFVVCLGLNGRGGVNLILKINAFFVLNIYLIYCIADYFTGEGFNAAALYHVLHGYKGAPWQDIVLLILVFFFCNGLLWLFLRALAGIGLKAFNVILGISSFLLLLCSVLFHPMVVQNKFDWLEYVDDEVDLSQDFHPNPELDVSSLPSLILIYAEGFERTFLDQNHFPGLAKNIKNWEDNSVSFHNLDQTSLNAWTIAGMFGSQCGAPLVTISGVRNEEASSYKGLTCLGRIYKNAGANFVYFGGARGEFSNKKGFYEFQGVDHFYDLNWFREKYPDVMESKWGVYDGLLLSESMSATKKMINEGGKFLSVTLTLDTHPPSGHLSPYCLNDKYQGGDNILLNAISCSDRMLSNHLGELVAEIEKSGRKDVYIAVLSDHMMINSLATDRLNEAASRRNLFFVITPEHKISSNDEVGTTLDIAPTLLSLMGVNAPQLGFGRDLSREDSLLKKLGKENMEKGILSFRSNMWSNYVTPAGAESVLKRRENH